MSTSSTSTPRSHHYESKIPGGKLVVADIETSNNRLSKVTISGDFFLDPDDAFEVLGPALEGASVSEDVSALESRLSLAVQDFPDLIMDGFTLHDVASVVRRAVVDATDFTDFVWDVIYPTTFSMAMNIALDETLLKEVEAGRRGPTVRFWDWGTESNALLGVFQSVKNEVNVEALQQRGMTLVRRMTGGGTMLMDGDNTITYSLVAPLSLVEGLSYADAYEYIDRWVIAGLKHLGVNAWYAPLNDITSDRGKLGGAAQKRTPKAFVHHICLCYDIDGDKLNDVLRVGKVKLADKGIRSANKRVDPLSRQTGLPRKDIIDSLIQTFLSRYDGRRSQLTEDEIARASQLVAEKYENDAWTYRLP